MLGSLPHPELLARSSTERDQFRQLSLVNHTLLSQLREVKRFSGFEREKLDGTFLPIIQRLDISRGFFCLSAPPFLCIRSKQKAQRYGILAHMASSPQLEADLPGYLNVARDAATRAGSIILEAWNKSKKVEHKGAVDLVTETDKECESVVKGMLGAAFPDHAFIGEEEVAAVGKIPELSDKPTWLVDPVDGTTNFVHRFPFSCVSIGLAINGEIVLGVVFNPVLNEMFHGVRGGGAYLNGKPIKCSDTKELSNAIFATEIGTRRDDEFLDACFARMRALTKQSRSVRACGSCALNLCSVAMGRLDAYYEIGLGGPWDLAGATLILEEAGGRVLDPSGGPFRLMSRRVLGTNAHLADPISTILSDGPWALNEPS